MAAHQQPSNSNWAWLGWILAAGVAFLLIKSCSTANPATEGSSSSSQPSFANAVEPQQPAAVTLPSVDAPAVKKAARHLKLALDVEGFPGAMIYSQNCFESLVRSFSWAKLDQCEAFDALAQLAIAQSGETGVEATYFDTDGVQARFTNAASAQHGDPTSAQSHLAELTQAALGRISDLQTSEVDAASVEANAGAPEEPGQKGTLDADDPNYSSSLNESD